MKKFALALAFLPGLALGQGSYPFCQILDRVDSPPWEVHGTYVANAGVSGTGGDDFGILRINGGGGIGYYRTGIGDFDITGNYEAQFFSGDGGLDLPDLLGAASVKGSYVWRNADGQAYRLSASPGLRSDLREITMDAFYVPFEFMAIQSFSPDVSGQIGVAVYPWLEELFDPRFGIRWAIDETLVLDLMYPESKLVFTPVEGWDLYAGAKVDNTPEWTIDDRRDHILLDETRAYMGLNHPVAPGLRMMYQVGYVFNRKVDFKDIQGESDVDDAIYLSVGLGGPL
jgi:hypothetical protein